MARAGLTMPDSWRFRPSLLSRSARSAASLTAPSLLVAFTAPFFSSTACAFGPHPTLSKLCSKCQSSVAASLQQADRSQHRRLKPSQPLQLPQALLAELCKLLFRTAVVQVASMHHTVVGQAQSVPQGSATMRACIRLLFAKRSLRRSGHQNFRRSPRRAAGRPPTCRRCCSRRPRGARRARSRA